MLISLSILSAYPSGLTGFMNLVAFNFEGCGPGFRRAIITVLNWGCEFLKCFFHLETILLKRFESEFEFNVA